MTETMVLLRRIWRQVFGKNSEKLGLAINASTNFFLVGGNSLLIIRLQARIRQVFNVTIRLVDLLSTNTLGQMARKIEDSSSVDLIDWEQETAPPSIPPSLFSHGIEALQAPTDQRKGPKTVLIKGATGYLGKHLLPFLAENPGVDKVRCVAVRDKPSENPQLSARSAKVVSHAGDLSATLLGRAEE